MLAEAVHSTADCGNQLLLLLGLRRARRPPTLDYPLGFGKEIYFWSFVVALLLFTIGGLFSIYEGIHKLSAGEPMRYAFVAMGILAFGIAAESVSLWGCLREVNKERGAGQSLWRWFRTSRQSELLVVLGEDLAALGGLSLALVFIGLAVATGDPRWDAAGSIAIGVLLIVVAVLVGVEVKALLVGQSAEPRLLEAMRAHLKAQPDVLELYNLLTQQLGSEIMVAVKARMAPQPSDVALIQAINRVERSLRTAFPAVRWIFFEPDVAD
jgi:cation diffusion facilitator family transporter